MKKPRLVDEINKKSEFTIEGKFDLKVLYELPLIFDY